MIQYPLGVNGVTTRVLDTGPIEGASGEPLILIHGVGSRADRFRLNIDPLGEAGYRTIAIDLPGHGLAQKGPLPYSVPYYADFLIGLMDELGLARAGVIGTSLGGQIGAYAAVEAPERFGSLVMVGTMGVVPLGLDARTAISRSIVNRTKEGIAGKLAFILQQTQLITAEWVEEEFRINNSPGSTEAFEALSEYFLNRVDDDVVGDRLSELGDGLRMLIIWGFDDKMITADVGHASHKILQNAPLILLRDAGHVPYLERPETFNDVVLRFLSHDLDGSRVHTL
jgi:2-hydroxy-6-oxonona-2,4-dienedioate hydrolase